MQNAALKREATAEDIEALKQLNVEYVRAVEEANSRWFDRHLAPDFLNSNPDGLLIDRQGFMAQIARGAGVTNIEAHDVLVRIMGDVALIHARTTYKMPAGKMGGGRYTDIWSREYGRWLCVAAHVTRG